MCGRYTVAKDQEALGRHFRADFSETHLPIYNASPGQQLPVILDAEPRKVRPALWGIPARSPGRQRRMLINARAETASRLPTFRHALRRRRCAVIADGFYEWQATGLGKRPYRIVLEAAEPFAFAGIWQVCRGEPAYVILTTVANALMRPIHDRMPVILGRQELGAWLDRDRPGDDLLQALRPYPESAMQAYRVSTTVNNSKNEGRELIDPWVPGPGATGLLFD